jgi:ATP-dependent RNA helicase DDX31/DBP7
MLCAAARSVDDLVPSTLAQSFVVVDSRNRLSTLAAVLRTKLFTGGQKMIIFLSTCDSVDFHHALFSSAVLPVELGGAATQQPGLAGIVAAAMSGRETAATKGKKKSKRTADQQSPENSLLLGDAGKVHKLHGKMVQSERTRHYAAFRQESSGVLFCTDVAARGLDIPNIDWIVQYDPPQEPADYIHRVGRTARAGRSGHALLVLQEQETAYVDLLERKGLSLEELVRSKMLRPAWAGGVASAGLTDIVAVIGRWCTLFGRLPTTFIQTRLRYSPVSACY